MTRTKRYLGGILWSYANMAVVLVVGLWLTPFYLRELSAERYGLWLVGAQVLAYLLLFDVGVVSIVPRETAYTTGRSGGISGGELSVIVSDAAQIALNDCALSAPMDALVLARSVEEGALVGSGTVGFTLADTTAVKVVFGVPDTVRDLKVGRPISVSVEAVPGTKYSGRITAIAASADQQSRVFDVEVTIPNPGGRLKAGMIAAVETPHESAAPGLAAGVPTVPLNAILKSPSDPNAYAVYVLGGDAARPVARIRDVKLGEIQGSRIAVTSGLSASDRVVVTGTTILVDGDPVRVIP